MAGERARMRHGEQRSAAACPCPAPLPGPGAATAAGHARRDATRREGTAGGRMRSLPGQHREPPTKRA